MMSSSKVLTRPGRPEAEQAGRQKHEIQGILLWFLALVALLSLISYRPTDPDPFFVTSGEGEPVNLIGTFGAFLANLLLQLCGITSYLIPVWLMYAGWTRFMRQTLRAGITKLLGLALLALGSTAFFSLVVGAMELRGGRISAGGLVGDLIRDRLVSYFNEPGAILAVITLLCVAMILATSVSLGSLTVITGHGLRAIGRQVRSLRSKWTLRRETRRKEMQRRQVVLKHVRRVEEDQGREAIRSKLIQRRQERTEPAAAVSLQPRPAVTGGPAPKVTAPATVTPPPPKQKQLALPAVRSGWRLPTTDLLSSPTRVVSHHEGELLERAKVITAKFKEFGIEGHVVEIHPGPVVTTFEFRPAAGIKYSRIVALLDDLCLGLQAESLMIERVPGKSTVGIEVPNSERELIFLRELLESPGFTKSHSKLTLALGKLIHGETYFSCLELMPHLLLAGATGSGKSVMLNSILCSILYKASPDEVKLILIDPKRLELGNYEGIPHLLAPVVTEAKQAVGALAWACQEMEGRYKRLASYGVRNIEQFNHYLLQEKATGPDGEPLKPLPYVVIVIDEFSDLMILSGGEVEESITRLAQMARAVGIHLVIATQRPSVDVITGVIKANFPSRISFRVTSRVDSRTILDSVGAEKLLGKGDMLFLPPGSARLRRIHGAFVSEVEIAALVKMLKAQGKPNYNEAILNQADRSGGFEGERDDRYEEAVRLVVRSGSASVSHLQRKLKLGYSRAARLVDIMEADGLVGPQLPGKQRDVLVPRDYFDQVDAQLR